MIRFGFIFEIFGSQEEYYPRIKIEPILPPPDMDYEMEHFRNSMVAKMIQEYIGRQKV